MEHLLGEDLTRFEEDHINDSFFKQYEMGNIDCTTFSDHLKSFSKTPVSDHDLDEAWNAMLGIIPSQRIQWLEHLKKDYQLALLSNTNKKHIDKFNDLFKDQTSYDAPSDLFDHLFYSHELNDRKPNESIYLTVLKILSINPEDAYFFDDKEENILAAEAVGIESYLVPRNGLTKSMLPNGI